MHFVVVGCGRVGSQLAITLESLGHTVAVIDNDAMSFSKLSQNFTGQRITGYGFDRDTLIAAGVKEAFAVAAVADNDNTNILAARVAREVFGVEKVVSRMYNTRLGEVFERMGIPTVATIKWTADQALRKLIPIGATDEFRDASSKVSLIQVDYDESWISTKVSEIENIVNAKVAFISRQGSGFLPDDSTILQMNDVLHVLVETSEIDSVSHTFGKRISIATKNESNANQNAKKSARNVAKTRGGV